MLKTTLIFAAVVVAFLTLLFPAENFLVPKYQECVSGERANYKAEGKYEDYGVAYAFSQTGCTLRFLDLHAGFFVFGIAVVIAAFTGTLWVSTEALAKAEREKRSIIRAGGQRLRSRATNDLIFQIEVSNAGGGAAVLRTIEWGFGERNALPAVPNYDRARPTEEGLFPNHQRPVAHVAIRTAGYTEPVIFFRFHYFDVIQGRLADIGFVMQIENPDCPDFPIFVTQGIPPAYLSDSFRLRAR